MRINSARDGNYSDNFLKIYLIGADYIRFTGKIIVSDKKISKIKNRHLFNFEQH